MFGQFVQGDQENPDKIQPQSLPFDESEDNELAMLRVVQIRNENVEETFCIHGVCEENKDRYVH